MALASLALVMASAAPAVAQAPLPTIAWDATRVSPADYARLDALNLEKQAVLRLMEEGFATVWPPAPATVVVRVGVESQRVVLTASGPAGRHEDTVPLGQASLAGLHLEIVHKAVVLARRALGRRPPPPPTPPPVTSESAGRGRVGWGGEVGVGALWRDGGVAVMPRVGAQATVGRRLTLKLQGAVAPSRGAAISVEDWEIVAGGGYRQPVARRFCFEVAALGGVLVHHYAVTGLAVTPQSGVRVGPVGRLTWSFGVRLWQHLALELRVAPGISRSYPHRLLGTTLWSRGALSIDTGVAFVWEQP